jgi:hypothetical protein
MGSNTDGFFLQHNDNNEYNNNSNSTDGIFLQYNDRIYECDEIWTKCCPCIGKLKCNKYRLK